MTWFRHEERLNFNILASSSFLILSSASLYGPQLQQQAIKRWTMNGEDNNHQSIAYIFRIFARLKIFARQRNKVYVVVVGSI